MRTKWTNSGVLISYQRCSNCTPPGIYPLPTLSFEEAEADDAVDARLRIFDAAADVLKLGTEPEAAVDHFGHSDGQRLFDAPDLSVHCKRFQI